MASETHARAENRKRIADNFGTNPVPDLPWGELQVMRAFGRDRMARDNNAAEFEGGWNDGRIERMWYGEREVEGDIDDLDDYEYEAVGL